LHNTAHPVFATGFTDLIQIAMNPTIAIDATAQGIGVTDERQQTLVIFIPRRDRIMQPRIEPGPGDIQYPTHRHHTPYSAVLIDKAVLQSGSLAKYRAAFFMISRSSSVRFSCARSFRISLLASMLKL